MPSPGDPYPLITVNLTKLETALEQVRKAYPKLRPTDAALVASALTLAGRHALALHEGKSYKWPEDYSKLTDALVPLVDIATESVEPVKKSKTAPEEEPIQISVGLKPDYEAGEAQLEGFNKLKTLLSDAQQDGIEFVYAPSDIGWQWALDRANWATIANKELPRRIKIKTAFVEGAVGVEQGAAGTKKRASRAKAVAEAVQAAEAAEAETEASGAAEEVEA